MVILSYQRRDLEMYSNALREMQTWNGKDSPAEGLLSPKPYANRWQPVLRALIDSSQTDELVLANHGRELMEIRDTLPYMWQHNVLQLLLQQRPEVLARIAAS